MYIAHFYFICDHSLIEIVSIVIYNFFGNFDVFH